MTIARSPFPIMAKFLENSRGLAVSLQVPRSTVQGSLRTHSQLRPAILIRSDWPPHAGEQQQRVIRPDTTSSHSPGSHYSEQGNPDTRDETTPLPPYHRSTQARNLSSSLSWLSRLPISSIVPTHTRDSLIHIARYVSSHLQSLHSR